MIQFGKVMQSFFVGEVNGIILLCNDQGIWSGSNRQSVQNYIPYLQGSDFRMKSRNLGGFCYTKGHRQGLDYYALAAYSYTIEDNQEILHLDTIPIIIEKYLLHIPNANITNTAVLLKDCNDIELMTEVDELLSEYDNINVYSTKFHKSYLK